MGIKVELDEELEKRFRQLAMEKFGYSKGSIKKATETAIRKWTQEERVSDTPKKHAETGVEQLTGLLKGVKHKSSVEEQHEIGKIWAKAVDDR
ncbi:MAG: hypothetical protein ACREBQ_00495 [Nitrososphaerales archaeon]